jgi:hypothetical protein
MPVYPWFVSAEKTTAHSTRLTGFTSQGEKGPDPFSLEILTKISGVCEKGSGPFFAKISGVCEKGSGPFFAFS